MSIICTVVYLYATKGARGERVSTQKTANTDSRWEKSISANGYICERSEMSVVIHKSQCLR